MVKDKLHPTRIKGAISEVGKDFWCEKCETWISGRTTPLIHETTAHLPREISLSRGHNYCRVRDLWKCNYCDFQSRSRNDVKIHLEKNHYYKVHPERIPKPEAPLVNYMVFIEPGYWKCSYCEFKGRKNKLIRHLIDAHKIQIERENGKQQARY